VVHTKKDMKLITWQ